MQGAGRPLTTEAIQRGWTLGMIEAGRVAVSTGTETVAHNPALLVAGFWWNVAGGALSDDVAHTDPGIARPAGASIQPDGSIVVRAPDPIPSPRGSDSAIPRSTAASRNRRSRTAGWTWCCTRPRQPTIEDVVPPVAPTIAASVAHITIPTGAETGSVLSILTVTGTQESGLSA